MKGLLQSPCVWAAVNALNGVPLNVLMKRDVPDTAKDRSLPSAFLLFKEKGNGKYSSSATRRA